MSRKAVKHRAVKHRAVKHDAVRHSAVKRSAVENGAVKHSAKQEAAMKQIIQQIGPNTRLAQLTMANWKAEKTARLDKATPVCEAGNAKTPPAQQAPRPYQLPHANEPRPL